jgi:glycosyltransferase involved in cell wall biosynthesis
MKNPLISIIIPIFNEEKYLGSCLKSLEEQTYKNLEIIVVDDGSTDKSLKIAKKFDVKILKQKHQGPGAARNLGAKIAKGSILVFVDADMKYDKRYVEKLTLQIIKKNVIGTFHQEEFIANSDNVWADCWRINSELPKNRRLPLNNEKKSNIFRAIQKKYFDKVGGFDISKGYFDDKTVSEKLKIKSVGVKDAISYHYNPSSLSEVYYSARWIGSGLKSEQNIKGFLRFCFLNSLRNAFKKIRKRAPKKFIIFKLVYDFGLLNGIFIKSSNTK